MTSCVAGFTTSRQALALGEVHHPLEINLHDAEAVRQANKGLELRERLAQACQPEGNARQLSIVLTLHGDEVAYIGHNAIEHVFAAHHLEDRRFGGIERNSQFIKAGVDQGLSVAFC